MADLADYINEHLDILAAAVDDEEKVHSATRLFKSNVNATIQAGFDQARKKRLPRGWFYMMKNKHHFYTSPLGHTLPSEAKVNKYIAFCKTGVSVAQINAYVNDLPPGWELFNDNPANLNFTWRCVSPDGRTMTLVAAKKFLEDEKQSATELTIKAKSEVTKPDAGTKRTPSVADWLTVKAKSEVTKSDAGTKKTKGSTQTTTSRKLVNGSTTDGLTGVKKNLFDGYVSREEYDQLTVEVQKLKVSQNYCLFLLLLEEL